MNKTFNIFNYFFLLLLIQGNVVMAQFQVNGNASSLGSNTYRLTPATNWQYGTIWYQVQHNLNNTFNLQGQLNLGNIVGGADGIVFVMQNKCLVDGAGGALGGGIGYGGTPGQSIAVEFDTFQNNSGSPNNTDPAYDHVAIEKNGNVDHANAAGTLAAPVQLDPLNASVKDGNWHNFQINYDPSTTTLKVYFNGTLRQSIVYDIKANIFGGSPYVYWGFVSATGGTFDDQEVKITSFPTSAASSSTICSGSSVQLTMPTLSGPNIAIGKTAVALSNNGGNVASNAIDGNTTGTRWESQQGIDPEWIYIDLINPSDIDSVVLFWENANAKQYKIQTSNDLVTWTDQFTEINGQTGNYSKKIVFTATNVRYVRMYGTQRNTGYGYSLYEFRVLGTAKYLWSPSTGVNNIYSSNPIFSPTVTTTYSTSVPDACIGSVTYSYTVTVNCAAPVEISEFNATAGEKNVHLTWTTASEKNSKMFEILRSFDGIQFSKIGNVDAFGNSNSNKYYEFDDQGLFSENAYYQLNEVDIDGKSQKSSVIFVTKTTSVKPYVLQTAFEEETLLILPDDLDYLKYKVIDMLGKEIYSYGNESPSHRELIGRNLLSGNYILIVESNLYTESIKINKLK